jgi:hypothetical protein
MRWFGAVLAVIAAGSGVAAATTSGWTSTRWTVLSLGMLAGLVAVAVVMLVDRISEGHRRPLRWRAASPRCSLCRTVRERVETILVCLTCDTAPAPTIDDSVTLL